MSPAVVVLLASVLGALVLLGIFIGLVRFKGSIAVTDVRAYSVELAERVRGHMQASYSGDPAQLESALRGLVPVARELASRHRLTLDDDLIRMLIASAVTGQRLAERSRVESALRTVMAEERKAA